MPRAREALRAALVFVVLTVVMTWPQARDVRTHVAAHFDSYFSLWRLAWIAHQLPTAPTELFEGNIFYPQRLTLALSDPILLPGLIAAPLLWAGASAVVTYNLLILGSFVLSGLAAWLLARHITGSDAAGYLAGIIFAFAPYRFEHLFHLEILWGVWIPIAFLLLHRATERGTVEDGVRTGLAVIGQALSCLYYAVYLGMSLTVMGPLLIRWRDRRRWQVVAGLAGGALAAVLSMVIYLQPLLAVRNDVQPRELTEAGIYSATIENYLSTPEGNRVYGALTNAVGAPERRLFPGLAAIVLAIGALLHPGRVTLAYLALLVFAMIASMGTNAPFFSAIRGASELVGMLRVPARFGAIFLCAIAVLAAMGAASLLSNVATRRARALLVAAFATFMLIEYSTSVDLEPVAPPSLVYRWLADQPPGPVSELPFPHFNRLPGRDAHREYYSSFHWQSLLNGYSGYYPISHLRLVFYISNFPRGAWIELLLGRGTRYIVIHERELYPGVLAEALRRLELHPGVRLLGRFPDPSDPAVVYERADPQK
jgi:hypothetical protein